MHQRSVSLLEAEAPAAETSRPRAALPVLERGQLWMMTIGLVVAAALMVEPLRGLVQEGAGRWLHVLGLAWAVCLSLTPLTAPLAARVGAVDIPNLRKIHATPTPRLGGLAVFAGIAVALAVNGVHDTPLTILLVASAGLLVVGAADDMGGISARLRLAAQIAASLLVIQGGLILKVLPENAWMSGAGNLLLTVLWLVGITNAFNFFDGMDGLAAGLALVMAGFLGAVAFQTGQQHLGWASVAIIGSAAAFLPSNFRLRRPAAIFLGDGGSTFLGFLLAGLAVHGEWGQGGGISDLSAPLLIFGVLVFDMVHTTVARIARGDVRSVRQWIEYTGRDHLHHRLEALLRSRRGSVLLILLLQSTLGLGAMVLRGTGFGGQLFLLLQCAAILLVVTVLEHAGNIHERRRSGQP